MSIFSKKPQQQQPEPNSTPAPPPAAPKWWQSVLAAAANTAVSVLLNHYLGPVAGIAGAGLGTAAAFHYQVKK